MPHVSSGGGDDLGSTDEVKVYNDEGEEEKRSSENLSEDKLGLVTESEEGKTSDGSGDNYKREGSGPGSADGKVADSGSERLGALHFPLLTHYPYPPNGATTVPGLTHPGLASLYLYNNDRFPASPPPAHMGIPPVHIDPKTGLPRSVYPLHAPPPGQFPHPFYPETLQWAGPGGYPVATGYRGPYPPLSGSPLSRFSPPGLFPQHPGMPPGFHHHHAIITPGPKQDIHPSDNHRQHHLHGEHNENHDEISNKKKQPRVKKPLNAFMLFMKEMRAKVIEECALKESAAINQILGRRWHALDRGEQAKYYEMARKEKELHQQLYPGWSARDNYAVHNKKKKRKRDLPGMVHSPGSSLGTGECTEAKKCRARFGLDAQNQWCKPCRRKKKCIRTLGLDDGEDGNDTDDGEECNHSSFAGSHTTDGESLAGGSPMPPSVGSATDENRNHAISVAFPRSPLAPRSDPLTIKPLGEMLHSPARMVGASSPGLTARSFLPSTPPPSMLLSPARHLHLTSTPGHVGGLLSPQRPSPGGGSRSPVTPSTSLHAPPGLSSSMLLAT